MFNPLEKDGSIKIKNYPFLGELYSFTDRLKGIGRGSIKIHYKSGIAEFDKLNQLNVDTAFVNFEPTTKGIILRFNKTNRIRAFGLAYASIHQIEIERILIKTSRFKKSIFGQNRKGATKGKLFIKGDFNTIMLEIPVHQVEKIVAFLSKLPICDKLLIV